MRPVRSGGATERPSPGRRANRGCTCLLLQALRVRCKRSVIPVIAVASGLDLGQRWQRQLNGLWVVGLRYVELKASKSSTFRS